MAGGEAAAARAATRVVVVATAEVAWAVATRVVVVATAEVAWAVRVVTARAEVVKEMATARPAGMGGSLARPTLPSRQRASGPRGSHGCVPCCNRSKHLHR